MLMKAELLAHAYCKLRQSSAPVILDAKVIVCLSTSKCCARGSGLVFLWTREEALRFAFLALEASISFLRSCIFPFCWPSG